MSDKFNESEVTENKKFLYSMKELADLLKCTIITAHKIRRSGQIPYFQAGKRKYIFDVEKVMFALEKGIKLPQ